LQQGLELALADVRAAVSDWPLMRERLAEIVADTANVPGDEYGAEVTAFLQWLSEDNFVLLGCRDYDLLTDKVENELHVRAGSGLGILRKTGQGSLSASFAALSPELKTQANQPNLLTLTKSNSRSRVHRPGYMDYVGVRIFDAQGRVTGERRLLGMLASTAYNTNPMRIPLLRRKLESVISLFLSSIRATSCSRFRAMTCITTPWASCILVNVNAFVCSCAVIRLRVSSHVWSMCRAKITTPNSASASRR
jgi:glutamate dehydrogenase